MFNTVTEEKIKNIPSIGDIVTERLPQELTRIYAQIVSLRRQINDGTINFQNENLRSSLTILHKLANNLEVILLTRPDHEQMESIAFVAATANSLISKMAIISPNEQDILLETDSISPFVASVVLFLIGNSQADAAEMAISLPPSTALSLAQRRLITCIKALATGKLAILSDRHFEETNIEDNDFQEMALNYLWRELALGVIEIAKYLTGQNNIRSQTSHFDTVIDLSVSSIELLNQRSVFAGPYRLAKLLKLLERDIFTRGVINIPPPIGVDSVKWSIFLKKLAKERPYLWENHKDAIKTHFLNPGTSSVLTLPTGAGKSTLSELKIASCLYSGKRAIYLVPTHALEDQVNKNLKKLFDDYNYVNIEIDAEFTEVEGLESLPILVMTPERCLTLLNTNTTFFKSVGLVVFDEFHLIHGTDIKKDRRSVDAMYCLLSLFSLIPQSDYLLISAMVSNGDEVCEWLESVTGRECILFNSSWKPTRQLHGCIVFEQTKISALNECIQQEKLSTKLKGPSKKLRNSLGIIPECFFSLKNIWETNDDSDYFRTKILDENVILGVGSWWNLTSNRNNIAANLGAHYASMGLKTLIFVDDPRIANSTSQKISEIINNRPNSYTKFIETNNKAIQSLEHELGGFEHSYFYGHDKVGVHHGMLLSIERTLIEQYFKEPDGAAALVATATLAQGINLPAEIVIIAGDDRFDDDLGNREDIKPHELLNAAGRAGRAGQSSQGAVILIPGDIVTIDNSAISERWWHLKEKVFSKGDQCLRIEDPLEYLLDSLQENSETLDRTQTNILYRFKAKKLSENETKTLLNNSFYAYKSEKENKMDLFSEQVQKLLERRNELDEITASAIWIKEISFKTGVDPSIVNQLSNSIDNMDFYELLNYSVVDLIEWYFDWLQTDNILLEGLFSKPSTINQIKRSVGMRQDKEYEIAEILEKIPTLKNILKEYVQGLPLDKINDIIPNSVKPDHSPYITKARNFVIRLVPEMSFSFGLLSMVIVEKARQKGLDNKSIPLNIRVLASCIREGFNDADKLFYKKNNNLLMRVETHIQYAQRQRN